MLWHVKVYLVVLLYMLGAIFIIIFPPRNFELSGSKLRTLRSDGSDLKLTTYVDYETIVSVLENMVEKNGEVAKLIHLSPRTAKNQSIVALQLRSDKHSTKPAVLIVGALNGMTWGAPNTILDIAEKLLFNSNYQTPFFNDYDWYLIPTANPDGLVFTQNMRNLKSVDSKKWLQNLTVRLNTRPAEWHKNVEEESGQVCFGTHINRNFAFHWQDDVRKTPEVCTQYYPGAKPFSSAEARALRAYVDKLDGLVHLAIHLHASFFPKKDQILYPWRYTTRTPSNFRSLQFIGEYAARQARLPNGRLYKVHQSSSEGRVAGTFSDYLAGVVGTDLVYLVKPYHQMFPPYNNCQHLETYMKKASSAIFSLVRGWRSSNKLNTLSFFGKDIEF